MTRTRVSLILAAGLAGLSGCNFAPHYEPPQTDAQVPFKEADKGPKAGEGWKLADPKDAQIPAKWWEVFADPILDDLESRVAISNQTVVAAEANYRAAYALSREARAALYPTLGLAPSTDHSRTSQSIANQGNNSNPNNGSPGTPNAVNSTKPFTSYTLPLDFSYQIDLWGSVRNAAAQSRYSAQASAAQVATALLSTESQLAQDYFQLRALDEQQRILTATLADYQASIHLVNSLLKSGVNSEEDVAQAQNQLATAEAQSTNLGIARAQYEHAIAVLIGLPPAKFGLAPAPYRPTLPTIPLGVPSDLLERRADIATAERQVAAANAQIGVARAAFFPALTLSASAGYEATSLASLFDWPNRFWSAGSTLSQTVFDGGERSAALAQARALDDAAVANYRQTVLSAFQSVEDNLASLNVLATELMQLHRATVAAQRAVELSVARYKAGVDSYVNVITAQNTFLSGREAELQAQLNQQIASVNLINNLGGGWSTSALADTERMAGQPPQPATEMPAVVAPGTEPQAVPATSAPALTPEELLRQNQQAMAPEPPAEAGR